MLTGKVSVDGKVAAESAPLFFLDGRTLKPLEANRRRHGRARGHDGQAQGRGRGSPESDVQVDALQEGLVIGVAKITINT